MKQELFSVLLAIDSKMEKEGLTERMERILKDPRPACVRKYGFRRWTMQDWTEQRSIDENRERNLK